MRALGAEEGILKSYDQNLPQTRLKSQYHELVLGVSVKKRTETLPDEVAKSRFPVEQTDDSLCAIGRGRRLGEFLYMRN